MTISTLKRRLDAGQTVLAPGVYDALSALIAGQAGFDALYLSGASIAYSRLGRSDVGLTTYTEVEDTLARITERVRTPVIVDADTGFGNALNTQRTVRGSVESRGCASPWGHPGFITNERRTRRRVVQREDSSKVTSASRRAGR